VLRKQRKDDSRQLTLCGERADLAMKFVIFPDQIGDLFRVVQQGFPPLLDYYDDKELKVRAVYPVCKVLHRVIKINAEIYLINGLPNCAYRIIKLVGLHLHSPCKGMACLQRTRDHVKGIGKLRLKFLHPFLLS
jgi:hypothetical protein